MNYSRALFLFGLLLPPVLPGIPAAEAASTDGSAREAQAYELEEFDNSTHWIVLNEPAYDFGYYNRGGGTVDYWIKYDNQTRRNETVCCEGFFRFEPRSPGIHEVEFRGRGLFAFLKPVFTSHAFLSVASENLTVEERVAFVLARRVEQNHLCLESNTPFDADVWSDTFKIDEPVSEFRVLDRFRGVRQLYGVYDSRDNTYVFVRMSSPGWLNGTDSKSDCRGDSALSGSGNAPGSSRRWSGVPGFELLFCVVATTLAFAFFRARRSP